TAWRNVFDIFVKKFETHLANISPDVPKDIGKSYFQIELLITSEQKVQSK
ncbi:384_t:CDS:2, partial [Dentiscutata heterogama]